MTSIVTGRAFDKLFGPWIAAAVGFQWHEGRGSTIGLISNGKVQAAALFENETGRAIEATVVVNNRINRDFLWFCFYYPFVQLGLNKVICTTYSENTKAIKGLEHLGFTLEATLKDASPKGDRLFYVLNREDCRWLSLRTKHGTETERTRAA